MTPQHDSAERDIPARLESPSQPCRRDHAFASATVDAIRRSRIARWTPRRRMRRGLRSSSGECMSMRWDPQVRLSLRFGI